MRIASLLSSATEIVHELGLGDDLVAISHECDYPRELMDRPVVSRSRFDPTGLSAGEVDAEVRRSMEEHGSVYEVDGDALQALRPEVVLTQAVCEVCAVPTGSVEKAVEGLHPAPRVVSLDAHSLEEIYLTVRQVAEAAGSPGAGKELISSMRERIDRVAERVAGRPRPRVLLLEWLDPLFVPGHWVPQMVELAGGESLAGTAGAPSAQVSEDELSGLDPDVLLLAPCGWGLEEARKDADRHRELLERLAPRAISNGCAFLMDGAYVSRSGPRVVEGIEAMAVVIHPDRASHALAVGKAERWTPGG